MKHFLALLAAIALVSGQAAAQLPVSGLPSATTPLGGTEVAPIVQGGVTKKVPASVLSTALQVTPQAYGALGNSNGTTGNGNDDTAAFQAALNAAIAKPPSAGQTGGVLYVPCGTYRLTAGLTATGLVYPNTVNIIGAGQCSQIYLDTPSAATWLTVSASSACSSGGPCLTIANLQFIPPRTNTSNWLSLTNWGDDVIYNVGVSGYYNGITLTSSYGPTVFNSTFMNMGGAAITCTADASCNNAVFWADKFFSVGATAGVSALQIGGNANNISINGIDCETNYGCIALYGATSVDVLDSYIERNTNVGIFGVSGTNQGINLRGNWFYHNGASNSFDLGNLVGVNLSNNTLFTQTITVNAATDVSYGYNVLQSGGVLARYCAPSANNCYYTGTGQLVEFGTVTTSSGSPGSAAVTFPIACLNAPVAYSASSANGSSVVQTSIAGPTPTGTTVYSTPGPATVNWQIACRN